MRSTATCCGCGPGVFARRGCHRLASQTAGGVRHAGSADRSLHRDGEQRQDGIATTQGGHSGISELVSAIVESEEIGVAKSAPEVLQHALDAIGVDPACTLFGAGTTRRPISVARSGSACRPPGYITDVTWELSRHGRITTSALRGRTADCSLLRRPERSAMSVAQLRCAGCLSGSGIGPGDGVVGKGHVPIGRHLRSIRLRQCQAEAGMTQRRFGQPGGRRRSLPSTPRERGWRPFPPASSDGNWRAQRECAHPRSPASRSPMTGHPRCRCSTPRRTSGGPRRDRRKAQPSPLSPVACSCIATDSEARVRSVTLLW